MAFLWALQRTAGSINYITDNENVARGWYDELYRAPPPGPLAWGAAGQTMAKAVTYRRRHSAVASLGCRRRSRRREASLSESSSPPSLELALAVLGTIRAHGRQKPAGRFRGVAAQRMLPRIWGHFRGQVSDG